MPLRRERMGGVNDGAFQHPGPASGAGRGSNYLAFNQTNITSPWALLRLLDLEIYALTFT